MYRPSSSNGKHKDFSPQRMDAVTILGVAAATVQFVDFASRIVSSTIEIYRSPSGRAHIEYEVSTLARDLAHLATQICNKMQFLQNKGLIAVGAILRGSSGLSAKNA